MPNHTNRSFSVKLSTVLALSTIVFAKFAFADGPRVGRSIITNPEITVERLDRTVDFILSQDPPFTTHGSLYGDCPFWRGGEPNVFVICVGFWTYGNGSNQSDRCRQIDIWKGDEMVPTGWMTCVSWKENGEVSFEGWGVGEWTDAERKSAEEALLAVLKACDHPPANDSEPEVPATGNQFSGFLAKKTVRLAKRLGHSFGDTNACEAAWSVPASLDVSGERLTIPVAMRIQDRFFEATALDRETNSVATARIHVMPSAFDAEFGLFLELGLRYEWGSWHGGTASSDVDLERDGDILFALPNNKSNYVIDDTFHAYAVCSNVLVDVWTRTDRRAFTKSLVSEGWNAGTSRVSTSTLVEYGDKRIPPPYQAPEKQRR